MLRTFVVAFIVLFPVVARAQCRAQSISGPAVAYTDAQAYAQAQAAIATNLAGPIPMAAGSTVGGAPIATTPVPGTIRSTCVITTFDTTGNGSCTYGNFTGGTAYTAAPDCDARLTAGDANYAYSQPIISPITMTAVSINMAAALRVLTIGSLGPLTVYVKPPTGTSVTMVCRGS